MSRVVDDCSKNLAANIYDFDAFEIRRFAFVITSRVTECRIVPIALPMFHNCQYSIHTHFLFVSRSFPPNISKALSCLEYLSLMKYAFKLNFVVLVAHEAIDSWQMIKTKRTQRRINLMLNPFERMFDKKCFRSRSFYSTEKASKREKYWNLIAINIPIEREQKTSSFRLTKFNSNQLGRRSMRARREIFFYLIRNRGVESIWR